MEPLMLDKPQVAQLLGVSEHTIERRVAAGHMPAPAKLGQLNRWSKAILEKWIAAGCLPMSVKLRRGARRRTMAIQL